MDPLEITRNYTGTDAFMTESARVNYNLAHDDLAKFTAFDSTIDTAWMADYLADVEAAETVVADSAVSDQQVQTTENVLSQMDLARAKYNEVKYFVQKAFPNSAAIQGEFGLNDYMDVRRSESKMIQFLDEMYKATIKYQNELIAAGSMTRLSARSRPYVQIFLIKTPRRKSSKNNVQSLPKTVSKS